MKEKDNNNQEIGKVINDDFCLLYSETFDMFYYFFLFNNIKYDDYNLLIERRYRPINKDIETEENVFKEMIRYKDIILEEAIKKLHLCLYPCLFLNVYKHKYQAKIIKKFSEDTLNKMKKQQILDKL